MFTVGKDYQVLQPLAQFFVSQQINRDWVQQGSGEHQMYPAKSDLDDGAGHLLVTAYALRRPDGQWSVMLVNRDQENGHKVRIAFEDQSDPTAHSFTGQVDVSVFGKNQYRWHPALTRFMAHDELPAVFPVVAYTQGNADPDGPVAHSQQNAGVETLYDLPAASVVVLKGKIGR